MIAFGKAVALQMSYWHYAVAVSVFSATPALTAPSNDHLANATVLTGSNITAAGSLLEATREPGEPLHYALHVADTRSVWWSWAAPTNATVLLSGRQSDIPNTSVAVYTGDSAATLTRITNAPGDSITPVPVRAGTTYRIAVADNGSGEANVVLTLQLFPIPPNDRFADRTLIPSTPASVFGWTVGASRESGESYAPQHVSVWWQWAPPATGRAQFRLNPPRTLFIFSATQLSNSFSTANPSSYAWGTATLDVTAGKPYAIAVVDPITETGAFGLDISLSSFAIAHPRSNQTFYAPLPIDIELQVTSFDTPVTRIDVFAQRNASSEPLLLGWIDQPPWRLTWQNPEIGAYVLTARATGPGREALSAAVPITIPSSNDLFAGSTVVSGPEFELAGQVGIASLEPGEPAHDRRLNRSLWWSWTAPANGLLVLSSDRAGDVTTLVYTGTTLTQLTQVARMDYEPNIELPVVAGRTYHLVAAAGQSSAVSAIAGRFHERPPNDDFASRIPLLGNSLSFSNSNFAATSQPGEPVHGGGGERRTLWWTWTAPDEGTLTLKAHGQKFHGAIAVYTNNSLTNLKKIAENGTHEHRALTLHTRAGWVYQIAVDGQGYPFESRGEFLFDLRFDPAPSNDLFADRATLTGLPTAAMADNSRGSIELGEPAPGTHPANKTLWWQWTAPRTARVAVTFHSCCYIAAVYQGSSLQILTRVPGQLMERGPFTFQAQSGQTYVLQISGFEGYDGGEFTVEIRDCPNDNFANRIQLSGLQVSATNDNVAATTEPGEPQLSGVLPARTLWWTWRPQHSGIATFRLQSQFSAVAGIYTGTNLASLRPITNLSTREYSGPVDFHAVAGTDYQIAIGSWHSAGNPLQGGYFDFSIDLHTFHLRSPAWEMAATVPQQITIAMAPTIPELHGTVRNFFLIRRGDDNATELLGIVNDSSQSVVRTFDRPGEYRFFGFARNDAGQVLITPDTRVTLRPSNDNFGRRITLTGTEVTATGIVTAVTFQPGEPKPYNSAYGSAWWSWTAPISGRYTFVSSNHLLAVYTGSTIGSLVAVASTSPVTVNAQAKATYQIQVSWVHPDNEPSGNAFTVRPLIRPRNDRFTNRTDLVGSQLGFPVSFTGASRDPGEPVIAGEAQNLTLWWRWVAPSDGQLSVRTDVNTGAYLHVYRGNTLASLIHQPQFEMGAPGRVIRGRSYEIVMTSRPTSAVDPRLQLTFVPAPSNDYFTNRIRVSGHPLRLQGSTVAATAEAGNQFLSGRSIWWSWTAPVTANALLSMTGSVTTPAIRIFRGATLNTLRIHNAVMVSPELYVFPIEAGRAYHICAVSSNDSVGPVTIDLSIPPPPANDDFTNSFILTSNHITNFADMLNATREPGEPEHVRYAGGATVWYAWTAPSDGVASFAVPHGLVVAVYTGTSLQTLQTVPGLTVFENHRVFRTISNATYRVAVASAFPTLAPQFDFDFPPFRGFEERQLLTGTNIQVDALSGGWWTWQAPASGHAELSLIAADVLPVDFTVYSGTSGHDLQGVTGSSDLIGFSAVAGRSYHIQVSGTNAVSFKLALYLSVPSIEAIARAPNSVRFDLRGIPGETVQLQTSTNLIDWLPLGLHTFYEPVYPFTDLDPSLPARFYRAAPVR